MNTEMMESQQASEARIAKSGALVSIVTVVYNGASTLERTIQSVLEQDWPEIEYIIIDGGSTDGTLDIIRRYEGRIARWISEKDNGIYDAMNKGVALCTGEWVGLINADDAYLPGAVRTAMEAIVDRPEVNVVHGDIDITYPNGHNKVKHARRSGFLLKYWEMVLNHPSFFVRRSYYADHPFNPSFRVSGDHLWTLRAWREDPGQFLYVPQVIASFSAGGASMTNPLRNVLRESDAMGRELGFTTSELWMARAVRSTLYIPGLAKLWLNGLMASLRRNKEV